jgi:hypothetical protein
MVLAAVTDGCAMRDTVADKVATEVLHEDPASTYECSPDETAGMVPNKPNEMHCCMTEVTPTQHDKKFTLTHTGNGNAIIGGEVPNYVKAELKAAGNLKIDIDGKLVRSFHAKHKAESHCATHSATSHGQCKPEYVRSRYDIEGDIKVESETEIGLTATALGWLAKALPLNLELGDDGKTVTTQQQMALCVKAPHTHAECSAPVECNDGQGPGCVLSDAGTSEGGSSGDAGVEPTPDGGQANACEGTSGNACFACCEQNASSQEELDACIAENQCG